MQSVFCWTILTATLLLGSRANAACVISGARPTATLPTMLRGQEFSFVASPDCETLRFTIRGTTVSKMPRSGGPVGPGPHPYKVVLTESEWDAVVAESGSTLTWVVTGRTSAGVVTRMVTTNDLERDAIQFDLSMADAKLVGENSGDHAGTSATVAGDVNGDGNDDLFVGARFHSEGGFRAGAAYLVLGPVTGALDLSLADAKLVGEDRGDQVGSSVSGTGDVDADGHDDLLLGASSHGATGAAYLVYGPVSGALDLSLADAKLVGEDLGADDHRAAGSVSRAGDNDADGHDDILVGTWLDSMTPGIAYLVHGPITGTFDLALADAKLELDLAYSAVSIVSAAGDVDADGHDDLLIGAPYDDLYDGSAYLVRGPVSGVVDLPLGHTKLLGDGNSAYHEVGRAVSGAGDIDGDGNDDLLIGAPGDDEGGSLAGAAFVVLGPGPEGTHDLADVAEAKLVGTAYDSAGGMVAGAGDVDLDGDDDLLVGASNATGRANAELAGAAYLVLSPVAGTMDLSGADIRFAGEYRRDNAGSGGGAGDVDGDGRPDLLLSAPNDDDGGSDAGAAYLIYGAGF